MPSNRTAEVGDRYKLLRNRAAISLMPDVNFVTTLGSSTLSTYENAASSNEIGLLPEFSRVQGVSLHHVELKDVYSSVIMNRNIWGGISTQIAFTGISELGGNATPSGNATFQGGILGGNVLVGNAVQIGSYSSLETPINLDFRPVQFVSSGLNICVLDQVNVFFETDETSFELSKLERIAVEDPERLVRMARNIALPPSSLTFIGEAAGRIRDSEQARPVLLQLLAHESPLVREGAIYGLSRHMNEGIVERLETICRNDPSPGVRAAAAEALDR